MNDKITIYVCHHIPYKVVESEIFTSIQTGRAVSNVRLDMMGDDTLDNISIKNPSYSEIPAHYWAWKNDKESDYVGFFHYRRYLTIKSDIKEQGTNIENLVENFGWTKDIFLDAFKKYDVIAPLLITTYPKTVYERSCDGLGSFTIDKMIEVIKTKYPHYSDAVDRCFSKYTACYYNIYVMKKKYTDEYAEFMFDILEEMETICRRGLGIMYLDRLMGYLAERLFNCYLEYAVEKYDIKICFANPVRVIKTENGEYDYSIGYI